MTSRSHAPATSSAAPPAAAAPECVLCRSAARVRGLYRLEEFRVVRCTACGLVFLDGAPSGEALYSEDYFQARKKYFFENPVSDPTADQANANIAEFNEALAEFRRLVPPGGRLVDVGCGIGVFLCLAREAHWEVQGVDISAFAAAYAREHFGLDVRQGTLAEAGFEPGSADVLTMWDLIEHVPDPVAELKQARDVLRPGGYLYLNTPNEAGLLKVLARLSYRASAGLLRYPVRKLYHVYHLLYFTPQTITLTLQQAGFEVVRIEKRLIPIVKARGSPLEKGVVRVLSGAERLLGMEYQLSVTARRP